MEKVINVSDAEIKTATIEVKVMRIGNRQVTLAVFRQLPREYIIDRETGDLRGIPWGLVNYHIGCENKEPYAPHIPKDHLHVVWQKGNELRHAVVYTTFNDSWQIKQSYAQLEQLDQLFIAV